jgi:G8 domain
MNTSRLLKLRKASSLSRLRPTSADSVDSYLRLASAATAVCIAGVLTGCGGGSGPSADTAEVSGAPQSSATMSSDTPAQSSASELTDDQIAQAICTTTPPDPGLLEPSTGASALAASRAMPDDHVAMLAGTFKWNVVASTSGRWNEPGTWQGGRVPRDGDNVQIPQGISVRVIDREAAALARVYVQGSLDFLENHDTRLIVDTMLVAATGVVQIGTPEQPLQAGSSAELVIQARAEAPLNVTERTRGILVSGRFLTNGPDKDNMAALAGDAAKGSGSLQFKKAPAGWAVGDEIVVTGTRFHWANSQDQTLLENEVRKITAINGSTVTLDAKLVNDHVRADPSFSIFVSNLTRPIVIRSAAAKPLTERGHVMFMKGSQADIRDAAFVDLGRTDKTAAITNSNIKGVYSVHFHQNGYDNEQRITSSVIRGTPGWGLANHSSNVVATNNVVHDFTGAAFSAEAGDEIGSFIGNIVSGGTQRPLQAKPYAREAIGAEPQQRLLAGDMGKFANGFWMVSPQVVVQNNVVAGGNGTAYLMFSLGTVEFGPNNPTVGQFTGFPLDRVPQGIVPRTWNYPNQFTGAKMAVTADLPIKDFRNNIAYGVFQGMRVRWTADDAGFMFNANKGVDVARFQTTPKNLTRQRYTLRDLTFWNVGSGMNVGYSENYDVDNLTVVNARDYDPGCNERFCGAYGFSTDGGGGMDARVSNSRISGGKTAPLDLADEMSTKNLFVDGKLYTKQ